MTLIARVRHIAGKSPRK